ncbi:excitatory amino acid transporter-like [Ostrea edulis]|uniref:excitatory amino acid transporter-like n=1 Tax=Ostrea edulis TaxID=37623 RepID=UPI0024AF3027|nr:excitatory amino acid transporter-like [Ostrea edulis]
MESEGENRGCCFVRKFRNSLRRHLLFILTLSAVIVGFSLGFVVREVEPSSDTIQWLGMPGELFMRLLKMMIIPLLVCSVIHSTASLDPKSNGKISVIAFTYILLTNILGCVIAVALFYVIKPGSESPLIKGKPDVYEANPQDIFADLLRNIIPDNIVEASFRQSQTKYSYESLEQQLSENSTFLNASTNQNQSTIHVVGKLVKSVGKIDGSNILGLIAACMFLGTAAGKLGKKAKTFLDFFAVSTEVVLQVLRWFIWLTPLGIASLIAASIAGTRDISGTFASLGLFVATVTIGIVLHQAIFLPLILFLTTRRNPYTYFISIGRAWLIAFAATSTAVAIPEMLNACENKNKVNKRVSRFVIPFCVTLNADGSALFITAAAMFIANITGQSLTFGDVVVIGLLTAIAILALPSVPSSSIVTLIMILSSLKIPVEAVSLLFAVEWFLDRIRTMSNLLSHTLCAAVTYHFCPKNFQTEEDPEQLQQEVEIVVYSPHSYNS